MRPSQSAVTRGVSGFHTLRRGFDPVDLCFRPRIVGVVEALRELSSGDKTLSSPGAAGPRRWPEGHLSPHAGSMSLVQLVTTQWGLGFHYFRGGIDPGDVRFRPQIVGFVEIWMDFYSTIPRCQRSLNVSIGLDDASCPGAGGPRLG